MKIWYLSNHFSQCFFLKKSLKEVPSFHRYTVIIFWSLDMDVGLVKIRQIREKKLGVTGLDRATRALENLTNSGEMLFFAVICLSLAKLWMVLKILLKKEIFEPIATFFTSIINDTEVWMKKNLEVFGSFLYEFTVKNRNKNRQQSYIILLDIWI